MCISERIRGLVASGDGDVSCTFTNCILAGKGDWVTGSG